MSTLRAGAVSGGAGLSGARAEVGGLLERNGMSGRRSAVAWFAFADPDSGIAAGGEGGDITRLVGLMPLPMRGAAILEQVAAIDAGGPRLVANFRAAFPADAAVLAGYDAGIDLDETAAPGWLMAACSLALGLDEADAARSWAPSADTVGLDTFVVPEGGRYLLDGRRLLRSLMSFRIGGAPNDVLARSVSDSLGHFVSDAIGRLLQQWRADAIVLAGDLFEDNAVLLERARRDLAARPEPVLCRVGPAAGGAAVTFLGRSGR